MPESPFKLSCSLIAANLLKKEALAQVLSCEFREVFKNIFLYGTSQVAASNVNTAANNHITL